MQASDSGPLLLILSGLPGTGKTSTARELSRLLRAVHLRIDTIEQTLREFEGAGEDIGDHGYRIAFAVAEDNLRTGSIVIADSVNSLQVTREAWRAVATRADAPYIDVEIVCTDPAEHRRRVESRVADIAGHRLPTWQQVQEREYEEWREPVLRVDSAMMTPAAVAARIRDELRR